MPLIISKFENGKPVSDGSSISDPTSLIDMHGMILSMAGSDGAYRKNQVISEHNGISEGWDGMLLSALRRRSELWLVVVFLFQVCLKRVVCIYSAAIHPVCSISICNSCGHQGY